MKKLIAFDLDGTLAESKSTIDSEISDLLMKLLYIYDVAVISGGGFPQFEKNLIPFIKDENLLAKLYLFPTCGTKAYKYENGTFQIIYSEDLSKNEVDEITLSIKKVIKELKLEPKEIFGELIENRGTQITYSTLGQNASYEIKKNWDPDKLKRKKIKTKLEFLLPNLEVSIGGTTSIDIKKKGIDKTYAIYKLKKYLNLNISEMIFIGDDLKEGGNDFPVISTGVECIETNGPEQTKNIIKKLINK